MANKKVEKKLNPFDGWSKITGNEKIRVSAKKPDAKKTENDDLGRNNKTSRFFVNFYKPRDASQINWLTDKCDISDCIPFIKYIRCDDGNDYQFLTLENNEIVSSEINDFEAVKGSQNREYFLCYTAYIRVRNLKNFPSFIVALDYSDNQVEIVLGFKDQNGNEIEDAYEEDNSKSSEFLLDDSEDD
jgi:hypothetical protein